jgi:NADH-quinone oxidoreductase subunit D
MAEVRSIEFREPASRTADAGAPGAPLPGSAKDLQNTQGAAPGDARPTASASGPAEALEDLQGDKMVLNMGPSHPSTHGVLRIVLELDGERITRATPHVGYLHGGDEKIAENMTYTQFIPYTDRLDYLAPLANNVAYALAVEKLLGIDSQLTPRCQYIRVICCELARLSSHLLGVGCFAMDVGAMTVFLHTFTEREKIYSLCEALTGARFTTSYTRIGGLARDLPPGWTEACRKFLEEVVVDIDETEKLLTRNRIFVDRTQGVGCLPREVAIDYGLTGPNLRASGPAYDVRKARPYLVYSQLEFDVPVGSAGDCYDRYMVRMEEMRQSVRLVHQCLDKLPGGPVNVADGKVVLPPKEKVMTRMEELIHQFMLVTQGVNAPPGEVYFGADNPKGELGFYINSRGGGTPYRLKIRAPSFVNLSVLPWLLPGHMVSDVTSILGSFDFVMGECDR